MSVAPDMTPAQPPRPDAAAAARFLCEIAGPGGLVPIAGIVPDGQAGTIAALTFTADDERGIAEAIRTWMNQGRNIHFNINQPTHDRNQRLSKADIASAQWLHIDLDPRSGESAAGELDRLTDLVTVNLPPGLPRPTVIWCSGGGIQAAWRLRAPTRLDGDIERALEFERHNRFIEQLLGSTATGADACHDVSRLLRVPFTQNLPNANKRAKGRIAATAYVIEFDPSRVYDLSNFGKAPPKGAPNGAASTGPARVVSITEGRRVGDLSELDRWQVPDRARVIIAQGHDPDNPKDADNSRSIWLFDAVCQLVRAGVDDETIFGIITDPAWPISDSVLDKGASAARYAARQIARAKEHSENPALAELNERHAVLLCENGKTRVTSWVADDTGRERLVTQSFEDFRNRYLNREVVVATDEKGQAKTAPLGAWWLKHPRRRQFTATTFRPGAEEAVDGYYNLWRGFAYEASAAGSWALLRAHIEQVLAAGNASHADYIIRFVAWALQNPGLPAEVALVLRGEMGTGKGVFAQAVLSLFGRHGMQVSNSKHMTGNFNAHLRDLCVLFADEAFAARDPIAEATLKTLITEPTLVVEGKGKDVVVAPNRLHVIMSSNKSWVAPAGFRERRFAIFDVSDSHIQDKPYFAAILAELKSGGHATMLHDLLAMDLRGWHPRDDVPQTVALQHQKELTLSPAQLWVLALIEDGALPGARAKYPNRAASRDLMDHARSTVPELRHVSDHALGRELAAWGCARKNVENRKAWVFPTLAEMRATWEKRLGGWRWADDQPADWRADDGHF